MKVSRAYQTEQVQKIIQKEPRLKAAMGPVDVVLETRIGRPVHVSRGAVAVVAALEKAGKDGSQYNKILVVRTAMAVLLKRNSVS